MENDTEREREREREREERPDTQRRERLGQDIQRPLSGWGWAVWDSAYVLLTTFEKWGKGESYRPTNWLK